MRAQHSTSFFRRSRWLVGVPREDVDAIASGAESIALRRGQDLWSAADPCASIYWVRSGCVRVELSGPEQTLILRFHGRGDVLGLAALYTARERGTRAVGHEECVVYQTPVALVQEVARRQGAISLRLSELLIERQRRLEARLAGVVHLAVQDRLLAMLQELAADFGIRDSRGVIIDLRLTHRELSALIGASRESVSLALQRLRGDGVLATQDRRVVLLRRDDRASRSRGTRRRV